MQEALSIYGFISQCRALLNCAVQYNEPAVSDQSQLRTLNVTYALQSKQSRHVDTLEAEAVNPKGFDSHDWHMPGVCCPWLTHLARHVTVV